MTLKPEFDSDGYPTNLTLEIIKDWPYGHGYIDLMSYVGHAWKWEDFVWCNAIKDQLGNDVWEYTLITGGWSGNESIISALERNHLFYHLCWRESHRGGKHVYEVKSPTTGFK